MRVAGLMEPRSRELLSHLGNARGRSVSGWIEVSEEPIQSYFRFKQFHAANAEQIIFISQPGCGLSWLLRHSMWLASVISASLTIM